MAETSVKSRKGRKIGRNKEKCKQYRLRHGGGVRKKITGSKEHRHCGPLGYFLRHQKWLDQVYGKQKEH